MAAGLGSLGLPPSEFWRMTPKEIDAAVRGRFGLTNDVGCLSRTDLAHLMQQFPDG